MAIPVWTIHRDAILSHKDEGSFQNTHGRGPSVLFGTSNQVIAQNTWLPASIWMCGRNAVRFIVRDQSIVLSPGEVLVLEAGARVSVISASNQEARVLALFVPTMWGSKLSETETGRRLATPLLFGERFTERDHPVACAMQSLLNDLERGSSSTLLDSNAIQSTVLALLRAQMRFDPMVARCPGRGFGYQRQLFQRLLRAHQYIEATGGNDASLNRLGAVANLSPTHFQRLFKTAFGYSPHDLATKIRMALAKELLIESPRGVAEICRDLGFENRCAFARLFRQYFGISPTEMRRRSLSDFMFQRHESRVEAIPSMQMAMA